VYVLEHEGLGREQTYEAIRDFLGIRGIEVDEEGTALEALADYRDKGVDFSDALLAAIARQSHEIVWTFNQKHFARMDGLWRTPPAT
jgi:predicted nucleic acid-binding protein